MPPLSPLASFFAGNPDAARAIRETHVDDGRGKRAEWPCTLRTAADRGSAAAQDSARSRS
jgi:hypothetical protein